MEEKDIDSAVAQLQADRVYLAECELQLENAVASGTATDVSPQKRVVLS